MTDAADTPIIACGVYRHYKGKMYQVIGVGKNTETDDALVIYQPLYDSDVEYWVRPYEIFMDEVLTDQGHVARFMKVS
jgi:hypothetical protein